MEQALEVHVRVELKVLITHNPIHAIFPGALEDFEGAVAMQE